MPTHEAFRVIGVRPDGKREICAAGVTRQTAESVATTVRSMRSYAEIVIEQEIDNPDAGASSQQWA